MEIVGLQFNPSERLHVNSKGIPESISDLTSRRVVQGFYADNTFPERRYFSEGEHVLTRPDATHEMKLVVGENAELVVTRNPKDHRRRNYVVVDKIGEIFPCTKVVFGKDRTQGDFDGVGIARRFADNMLALEWYIFLHDGDAP